MTSGEKMNPPERSPAAHRRARRRLLLGAAGLWLATPARALDLPGVMGLLAQRRSGEARFSEQRFVSGFDQPLSSSGTLNFRAPDRFERRTVQPRAEAMIVDGDMVTIERGGRVRELRLDAIPEMAAVVNAVRGTLSGDAAALRRHFDPTVSGSDANWTILLAPLDERLAAVVRPWRSDGARADVRRVEIQLADGDRSVMDIEPLVAGDRPRSARP
jgi:hypothetical protein